MDYRRLRVQPLHERRSKPEATRFLLNEATPYLKFIISETPPRSTRWAAVELQTYVAKDLRCGSFPISSRAFPLMFRFKST